MSGTVEDVISVAESQLGETDGAKYFNELGAPDLGPWCVAFVRWVMSKAGVAFDWHTWYAWDYSDAPKPIDPRDLQPGDTVSFDWDDDGGGDHVGIVKSVHDWGICTIEGNTGGGIVAEKQRVWDVIICGIRPRYDEPMGEWIKKGDRWWYRHPDGSWTADDWEQIDGKWYYFDADGWMLASTCKQWRGNWYALGADGAMLTGDMTNPEHDGTYGRLML